MSQKALKIFLIDRVDEFYFICFVIVSLAFIIIHPAETASFVYNPVEPYDIRGIVGLVLLIPTLVFYSWQLIKETSQKREAALALVITLIPLMVITPVTILGLLTAIVTKASLIEIIITAALLIKYSVRMLILIIYGFLERYDFRHTRTYKNIRRRVIDAVSDYQVTITEAFVLIGVGVVLVIGISFSSFNLFSQYVLAFTLVHAAAKGLKLVRTGGLINN